MFDIKPLLFYISDRNLVKSARNDRFAAEADIYSRPLTDGYIT